MLSRRHRSLALPVSAIAQMCAAARFSSTGATPQQPPPPLTPRELATQQRAALAKAASEFGQKHAQEQQRRKQTAADASSNSPVPVEERTTQLAREVYESKKQSGGASFKVKRKAPWGAQQLRDAWSEDAMARHDKDSVGDRIDREYRYHPEAFLRRHLVIVGWSIPVLMVVTGLLAYYWASGQALWKAADFQTMLNIFRQLDTSPRSALYLPRTAESQPKPYELTEGDGPRRRRVGAREEYEALVAQYKALKEHSIKVPSI